ncbi:GNAT family N-acetyltransferase [Clostridium sp. 'White wine YQ']|uniref:GNAT family N-acetyltransferase n=1 Tax=Clostridium sp. 'White wine YQ' TaxID=3027474 RepID=UPI00236687CA|nr:GNAT family N-acetyltransferase [Clostridium sp. 'White wine YQ']MDD7793653.1 GNAT family N-acetyltransferase [Clostridium sp. 'White wine YQ']
MKIIKKNPSEVDAIKLMDELSESLENITGASGKNSFDPNDVLVPRSLFVIAYDDSGQAIGCGAFRPISENTAEVKRMFAKVKGLGIGTIILKHLELEAKNMGYDSLLLETRVINKAAVNFYRKNNYIPIENYGKYTNNPEAICFQKNL